MENRYYLPCLNGWRAISILLVMAFHGSWLYFSPEGNSPNGTLWHYFFQGSLGVQIFFSISGFLITSRILEEYEKYGTFNIKEFYLKRFFRIFPPYYAYLLIISVLSLMINLPLTIKELVGSGTFLRIYMTENVGWYTGHSWSLCVEEHFYIILSLVFFFISRKNIFKILPIIFIAIIVWNFWSFRNRYVFELNPIFEFFKVIGKMEYMVTGAFFAFLNYYKKFKLEIFRKIQPALFVGMFLVLFLEFRGKGFVAPVIFSFMIYITAINPHRYIYKVLENKVMNFIGKLSYSLYLWQQLLLVQPKSVISEIGMIQKMPLNVVLVFILAYLSYRFIEQPTLAYGRKFIKNKV